MRLCDRDIYQYLQDGKIKIDPQPDYDQISGLTVDIRLGNKFRVFEDHAAPYIDLSGPKSQVQAALESVMSDEIELPEDKAFFLHPKELALAITHESVTLPDNIVGWLDGRSSRFRRKGETLRQAEPSERCTGYAPLHELLVQGTPQ